MVSRKLSKFSAVGVMVIALAIGTYTIGHAASGRGGSSAMNATAVAQQADPGGPRATPAPGAANGPVPAAVYGQVPQDWHPGSGTASTGPAADEATAVAVAMFPGGTVNRVLQLSDGSYAVHIIGTSGPHHVFVSQDFTVTGAA
ncbi:MAG TPA: hypothetical protein VK821_04585 [Dehalococcoidia bacterium]|nr:hypothetical protein [Dehalococcoidia bacterium]